MDRIEQIKELEAAADKDTAGVSAVRWASAKLMWEEVRAGGTKQGIADAIGKSRQHVTFVVKCWEMVGRNYGSDFAAFPNFGTVYISPEVRGESARNRGSGKSKDRDKPEDKPETASAWIATADGALDQILANPAAWQFLGVEDLDTMRALSGKATIVLEAIENRLASA
jgi:hypothetical protein